MVNCLGYVETEGQKEYQKKLNMINGLVWNDWRHAFQSDTIHQYQTEEVFGTIRLYNYL